MGNYNNQFYAAVANGTVFNTSLVANATLIKNQLAYAEYNILSNGSVEAQEFIPAIRSVANSFTALSEHVEWQYEDFVKNTTIFDNVFFEEQMFDVNSYFGTIIGKGDTYTLAAQPHATFLASFTNTTSISDVSNSVSALTAIASNATSQIALETTHFEEGMDILEDKALASYLNEQMNSPIGQYILARAGSDETKAIAQQRDDEVRYELGLSTVDDDEPISLDPTPYADNSSADPLP